MVKLPTDVLKEVYVRKTTNEKINIQFETETFRDALIQHLIIYKVQLEMSLVKPDLGYLDFSNTFITIIL